MTCVHHTGVMAVILFYSYLFYFCVGAVSLPRYFVICKVLSLNTRYLQLPEVNVSSAAAVMFLLIQKLSDDAPTLSIIPRAIAAVMTFFIML